ncbi:MAG: DUF1015 domain-containing protein [Coriobacteriia bacterium]|nr:DUF1015 domain-containing protein [Coriobacteriia bacterium]
MADVRPFRAVTYARTGDVTPLTAPPYDVITPALREELLSRDPRNVVALELPEGPLDPEAPGNRYARGAARWREWLEGGVLAEDASPAVYVLEQRFDRDGHEVRRRGLVAAVALEPFEAGVILPHERTLPKALSDRLELLRATRANLSSVFGLYHDPAGVMDAVIDAAQNGETLLTATDEDGVTSRAWAMREPEDLRALAAAFAGERVFIADGHHRYTVALAYRDERRAEQPQRPGPRLPGPGRGRTDEPDAPRYDFVMMTLTNMEDPGLAVLPTHRVADAAGRFDPAAFRASLEESFEVTEAPEDRAADALLTAERPAFLLKARGDERVRLAVAREGWADSMTGSRSHAWKTLDVAVLQELVLDPLLGIHPDRPETLDRLEFAKDADEALQAAAVHDVAFLLRPIPMEQMRRVALAGETMPQKSTYFHPKLRSGLLFRRAD